MLYSFFREVVIIICDIAIGPAGEGREYFESLPIRYDVVHYYSQVISCVYFFSPKENSSSFKNF